MMRWLWKVTKAEALFAAFIAQHNLPFSVADHFSKLAPKMFPDSSIAKQYGSARTKTTMMVREVYGPEEYKKTVAMCQSQKFGLLCDESTDRGISSDKNLVILVRVYDEILQKPTTRFLDMPTCNIGTADHIFNTIQSKLSSAGIPLENLSSFNSDNCSVMKGARGGLIAKLRAVNDKIVDIGCCCHLANLAVEAMLKKIPDFNIDQTILDITTHFAQSTKRKEEFKEFQEFTNTEAQRLLKHCPTRWLSLTRVLPRIIQQYEALKSYFQSHPDGDKPRSTVSKLRDILCDPLTLPWFHFILYLLAPYSNFNQKFQSEDLLIFNLHKAMVGLVRRVMVMFVKPNIIREAASVINVSYDAPCNQVTDNDLCIGTSGRTILSSLKDELTSNELAKFYRGVRDVFTAGVKKMIKVFPLNSLVLQLVGILDPKNRDNYSANQVVDLAKMVGVGDEDAEQLSLEYIEFLVDDFQVPDPATSETTVKFWNDAATNYPKLVQLMRILMTFPHSNAASERMFSMLRKIHTDYRDNLCQETITALLSFKVNSYGCCIDQKYDSDRLKALKKAAMTYNDKHPRAKPTATHARPALTVIE